MGTQAGWGAGGGKMQLKFTGLKAGHSRIRVKYLTPSNRNTSWGELPGKGTKKLVKIAARVWLHIF